MATTQYFAEKILDQGGRGSIEIEIGRSSFYSECELPSGGIGEDSIYINVDGKLIIMDRAMAKKFVDAVMLVGTYHNFI